MINHQNNFVTNLTSNQSAGVTTTPLNSIPTVDPDFYLAFDATNINSHYEVVKVTSKTATNVNHASTSYAHTTDEEVRMIVPAVEMDNIQTGVSTGWTPAVDTLTYVSATEFKITGKDKTDIYTKGTKIKLDNSSATKYFYIVSSTFSTDTTVVVTGETDLVSGAITNPYYSYADNPQGFKKGEIWHKAMAHNTSAQSIPANSWTKILLPTTDYNPNANFDTSNSRFNVKLSGYYRIIGRASTTGSATRLVIAIFRNGSEMLRGNDSETSGGVNGGIISGEVHFAKGDYVELYVYSTVANNTEYGANAVFLSIKFSTL